MFRAAPAFWGMWGDPTTCVISIMIINQYHHHHQLHHQHHPHHHLPHEECKALQGDWACWTANAHLWWFTTPDSLESEKHLNIWQNIYSKCFHLFLLLHEILRFSRPLSKISCCFSISCFDDIPFQDFHFYQLWNIIIITAITFSSTITICVK